MNQPVRFPFLNAIRGLCILGVVAVHCFYSPDSAKSAWAKLYTSVTSSGWLGVPVFFVLSGFLISLPMFAHPLTFDWERYTIRRIIKIGPPFIIVVGILALAELLFNGRSCGDTIVDVMASLSTLAHFWSPWPPLNGAFWSLYVEIHFYLLLPILFLGIHRIVLKKRKDSVAIAGGVVIALFLVVSLIFRILDASCLGYLADHESQRFALFPRSMDYFAWGMLFSLFYATKPDFKITSARLIGWMGGAGLMAVYALYAVAQHFDFRQIPYWFILEVFHLLAPLCTFLCLFFCYEQTCSFPLFRSQVLGFMGVVSYEWYLIHGPVRAYLKPFTAQAEGNVFIYFWNTGAPLSLALSTVLFYFVSKPLLDLVHKKT